MKIEITNYKNDLIIDAYCESSDSFDTFGGESWVDDYNVDEYGLDFGDLTIWQIPSSHFKSLAIKMVDHLLTNGYDFELYDDKRGNGTQFRER